MAWLGLVGCGDDGGAGTGGEGGGGAAANQPPTIESLEPLTVGEGRSAAHALVTADPEGGALTVVAEASPGFDAGVIDGALVVHAPHGATTGELRITATDPEGAETTADVALRIAPLAWTETVTWGLEDGPEAREHASVLVDDASGSIYVMFGSGYSPYLEALGDAWRFDVATRTWSEVTLEGDVPPPGGSRRLAGTRGSGEGWLFGGYGEGQEVFGELYHVVADGDVLTFDEVPQENAPRARVLHVFAQDPATGTFVLFGGATERLENDTWTMVLDGGTARWTIVNETSTFSTSTPSPRFGAFYGMDEASGRLLLFSGQTSLGNVFGQDTWVLDVRAEGGPTWTALAAPGTPVGRRNGTSVWDPTGPRLFVFGGTSDGATTQPGLFALDARAGRESWSTIDRAGQPALRSSGFGGFVDIADDAEAAVWMGFGNDDTTYRDLARLGHAPPPEAP